MWLIDIFFFQLVMYICVKEIKILIFFYLLQVVFRDVIHLAVKMEEQYTSDIERKELLQKRHYFFLNELQQMARELPGLVLDFLAIKLSFFFIMLIFLICRNGNH